MELATPLIVGDARFIAHTGRALELLALDAPGAYAHSLEYIRVIRQVEAGSRIYVATRTFVVGEKTAWSPGFGIEEQVLWFASSIVHDAGHSRLYYEGEVYKGRGAELACAHDQVNVLEALGLNVSMGDYTQSWIEGIDDPANAHWNHPSWDF